MCDMRLLSRSAASSCRGRRSCGRCSSTAPTTRSGTCRSSTSRRFPSGRRTLRRRAYRRAWGLGEWVLIGAAFVRVDVIGIVCWCARRRRVPESRARAMARGRREASQHVRLIGDGGVELRDRSLELVEDGLLRAVAAAGASDGAEGGRPQGWTEWTPRHSLLWSHCRLHAVGGRGGRLRPRLVI